MFDATRVPWNDIRDQVEFPTRLFVNGSWVQGSGDALTLVSPRNGENLATIETASVADVDLAVQSAREAFESRIWSGLAPRERGQIMMAFAQNVHDHAEELALMISLEMGKPVSEALQTELRAVVNCLRWYGEAADKIVDEVPVTAPGSLALVTREAAGVVAAIVPWNFPLTMTAWKLGPSLVAGNSVVLKPDEHTSASALMLGKLAFDAGIPAGVLNVVPGYGRVAGRALAEHHDVDVLTFTGSTGVGRALLEYSAQSNGKRVWLELGGKTPSVVLEDADFVQAVTSSAQGCFYNMGQMCTAASRLLVPEHLLEQAVEIATEVAKSMSPSDPMDLASANGSLVSATHLERVRGFVDRAKASGTRIYEAELSSELAADGSYFAPVVAVVDPTHELAQNEVFGPVLAVIPYRSEEEALEIANGTEYGLASVLWTQNLTKAHELSRKLRSGVVWVNCFEEGDMTIPFGGVKGSGFGRDKSLHAIEKFTDLKTTWIQL
ncbi:aldehyde dehydrogenase family protein [Leucobacter sp. UT-8R-CII-1-4]|uniref:aldehyde dehydrogenase family protein n=1 Tax=Leucobacter sp. UT-8R-CII-1-4 TaxID=3040075 RepID=UPI0024A927B5|nr:aldehyde dehydrogenase family protein [Leucobacter sp. UT-8R-CII-1-4]MDI6023270.1 aldehyde dehydrogenase family protein [Leucobacter sp. UT-8R-CII-1-4]